MESFVCEPLKAKLPPAASDQFKTLIFGALYSTMESNGRCLSFLLQVSIWVIRITWPYVKAVTCTEIIVNPGQ